MRALARVGQLMLNRGRWDSVQLFDPNLVDSLVAHAGRVHPSFTSEPEPPVALGWWVNVNGFFPSVPNDAYMSVGAAHQAMLIIPSKNIVMVRLGGSMTGTDWRGRFWQEMEQELFAPFMEAIR